jgi:carboxyl-terminal processing protease
MTILRKIEAAATQDEAKRLMSDMISQLPSSHLAIIPEWAYTSRALEPAWAAGASTEPVEQDGIGSIGVTVTVIDDAVVVETVDKDSPAMQNGIDTGWKIASVDGKSIRDLFRSIRTKESDAKASLIAGIVQSWLRGPVGSMAHVSFAHDGGTAPLDLRRNRPPGKMIEFGNLPPEPVCIEHRLLPNGVGYIRLNIFLDPVSVMPQISAAVHESQNAPAVVLDLRNNPGGLGVMAMGIAGWFVAREGLEPGTMMGRETYMKFEINPISILTKGSLPS